MSSLRKQFTTFPQKDPSLMLHNKTLFEALQSRVKKTALRFSYNRNTSGKSGNGKTHEIKLVFKKNEHRRNIKTTKIRQPLLFCNVLR